MQRQAGVLLHPTSLPNGVLDHHAWNFLDWMTEVGFSVWQMLPLTPPVEGISPYHSDSVFAMNPKLLPDDWQQKFDQKKFEFYLKQPLGWLKDYALFKVLKKYFKNELWSQWPETYRDRNSDALVEFENKHIDEILIIKKEQFAISDLWQKFKHDANQKGIQLFGDMPIFVAYDSVDVWANSNQFKLDENFNPTVVTGVPPDYFSEVGQRWGNPHYDWKVMEHDDFNWWIARVRSTLSQFDVLRLDHFRGLEAVWEIDVAEETAINGSWVKSPGAELLTQIQNSLSSLRLVAEDLGMITPEVVDLKNKFNLPGMSVLQFGFDGHADNPHSLHNQLENSIVYSGTHDNDTTLGWLNSLEKDTYDWIRSQLPECEDGMVWSVIMSAFNSSAKWAIIPMQDILGLDSNARMNVPGTIENNWLWKFNWSDLDSGVNNKVSKYIRNSERKISCEVT